MATATKKAPVARSTVRAARSVPESGSLVFLTYRDNGGHYHWEIVDARGETLAHSRSFVSLDDAERAARDVHEGARSSHFESQPARERRAAAA